MIELYFINYNNNNKKDFLRGLKGVGDPAPSFFSTLKTVKGNGIKEELNKKVGRGKYALEKKYLISFILMAQFCNTCNEVSSFRNWKKGLLYSNKGVLECMVCKEIIYV